MNFTVSEDGLSDFEELLKEINCEKSIGSIIQIYNDNMNDTIPEIENNKKYQYIRKVYYAYGYDFIDAVIEICVEYKLRNPFAFFKSVIEDNISMGVTTDCGVRNRRLQLKDRWRQERSQQKPGFNNFPQRDYDFDYLERKLLGWD